AVSRASSSLTYNPDNKVSPAYRGAMPITSAARRFGSSPVPAQSTLSNWNGSSIARVMRARGARTPRASRPMRPCSRLNTSSNRLVSRQARACRIQAGWFSTRTMRSLVAESIQRRFVIRPAFAHLHPQTQESAAADQGFDAAARGTADLLQAFAAGADHDLFLAFALHPDHRRDFGQAVFAILERFDFDRRRVGQFLAELAHQLFADQLRAKETLAAVGEGVRIEHRLALRQAAQDPALQVRDAFAALRAQPEDFIEGVLRAKLFDERQQRGLVAYA